MVEELEEAGIKEEITCLVCGKLKKDIFECLNCHKFYCKDCSLEFQKKNKKCISCNSVLKTIINKGLNRLIELNSIKPICQKCKKIFDNPEEYNIHIEKCNPKGYICKKCDIIFLATESFIEHIHDNHKKDIFQEFGKIIKNNN